MTTLSIYAMPQDISATARRILVAMVERRKSLISHRKGWVLADGSISCEDSTANLLFARGYIEKIEGTAACRITEAGRAALAVKP